MYSSHYIVSVDNNCDDDVARRRSVIVVVLRVERLPSHSAIVLFSRSFFSIT